MDLKDEFAEGLRERYGDNFKTLGMFSWIAHATRSGRYVLSENRPNEVAFADLFAQQFAGIDDLSLGWIVGNVLAFMHAGDAGWISVELGETPFRDAEIEANTRALRRVPHPFSVDAWFGKEECDGVIAWSESLPWGFDIVLTEAALEVGHTDARTLWFHLVRGGGFARWPYGSEHIYIFQVSRPAWSSSVRIKL